MNANEDAAPDDGRNETGAERSDRNWTDILQELRVTQTGTQIISGFLLAVAFQQRFPRLTGYELVIYVVLVALASAATLLGLSLVGLHRAHFGRHDKDKVVRIANRLLTITAWVVAILTGGVVLFIVSFVVGIVAGLIAAVFTAIAVVVFMVLIPRSTVSERADRTAAK